ncbi:hypothetical protein ACFXCZ_35140 [Streptomyces sp. NPDC059396]|uniref:hypothetical protein n=1 Tax=Streptomyces sp. NPDC059396 TaxID=3346819 RepID=UPI0036C924D4
MSENTERTGTRMRARYADGPCWAVGRADWLFRSDCSGEGRVVAEHESGSRGVGSEAGQSADAGDLSGGSERPFLQRPQGVLAVVGGVVGVVAGVLGLVFLLFPDLQPEPEPDPVPGVDLVDFDLEKEDRIQADWTNGGGPESGVMKDWKASLVTVVLRNNGDNPVLVSQAEFRFSSVTEVGCPYGAGGLEVKARYDVKVPAEAQAPFRQVRKMKYTLPPHEQERVAFTVGPESVAEGSLPQVYRFAIILHLDDKTRIEVPEVTYMDPSSSEAVLWSAERAMKDGQRYAFTTVACVKEQERKAREILEGPGKASSELKQYSAALTRLVGLSPPAL